MYTISPYLAEFLGTLIMCTIGCGVIANVELRRSKGHGDNFFTIAFGWGFAVTFGVYASHAYSGGHLNPAVSIGLDGQTGYALNPARDFGPRLMHALLPIHDKGSSRWSYAWVPICGPIAGGFMGGAFFKLYYEGQVSPWLFVSTALAIAVLLFAWWANSHLYRAPSSEVVPELEDTHATAAARAATYTPTGSMPVLLPEEVKANRSTRVVNRLADNE